MRNQKSKGNRSRRDVKSEGNALQKKGRDKRSTNASEARNDVEWYAKDKSLLRDVASFPYGVPLGSPVNLASRYTQFTSGAKDSISKQTFPGIYVVDLLTSPGISRSESSAVNLAMRNIFAAMRRMNSKTTQYDPADVMLYIMSMDEVYTFYYSVMRIYGLMQQVNLKNRYYPRSVVEALGYDFDDLSDNLANFRAAIGIWALKIAQIPVPDTLPVFKRHKAIFSNVYMDGISPKAQTYAFRPAIYRTFEAMEAGQPGYLKSHWYPYLDQTLGENYLMKLADIERIFAELVNPIINNSDTWIISGDIQNAYNTGNVILERPAPDYVVTPVLEPDVLMQLHNATLLGIPKLETTNISQDVSIGGGFMKFFPEWSFSINSNTYYNPTGGTSGRLFPLSHDKIISLDVTDATPELTMEATRLTNIPRPIREIDWNSGNVSSYVLDHCGADIALIATCHILEDSTEPGGAPVTRKYYIYSSDMVHGVDTASVEDMSALYDPASLSTVFRASPRYSVYFKDMTNPTSDGWKEQRFFELDTWVVLNENDLAGVHDVAQMNVYGLPQTAFVK